MVVLNISKQQHLNRFLFPIHDDGGLILASEKSDMSHEQMFYELGFSTRVVEQYLLKYPRGYYMDDVLCIYQGASMTPHTKWELSPGNYPIVQQYIPDLRAQLNLKDDTILYLGVVVGEIGRVWERINKTTIGEFMRVR